MYFVFKTIGNDFSAQQGLVPHLEVGFQKELQRLGTQRAIAPVIPLSVPSALLSQVGS